ncbi:DUF2617 family protein [Gordonia rubripertincta]|uniref:DUF2617 family protein n=2 Tax=Gordonia rubripertincta TaxID=36822 RepID=A0AAW4G4J0_GORRU|nr:DUF2617 family protein [Gordonia rubripertincta]MBM7278105.1 DUF2617 family protein [Gordonia rubripertincta]MDG6781054.1 DUF2617 family protein [Gordonia rubripertincta]NKY62461.1 DUF2617 family protein [Gordonia rubripertincta]QMU22397.1 DUF2617 family protein [Gordonia rubripertincta]TSD94205.1 DUF2617 family protein [Gordonia rubripertincta]
MSEQPIAELLVAYADTSAAQLGFSLDAPLQEPLAREDGEIDGITVSVRLLGASHQVVVDDGAQRICETVACLPDVTSALPETFQESGYHFSSRVERATDDQLATLVEQLGVRVTEQMATGNPSVMGAFPGDPHAVTAIVSYSSSEEISWHTWHTYPQAGEVVITSSVINRGAARA